MKLNLLKKLLTLTPVVISPVLVTACGDKDDTGNFYVKTYQSELNTVWQTKVQAVNQAALNSSHQYDLKKEVLDETLTKVKATGAAKFKKEFPDLDNYNAANFNDIKVSFTIPKDSSGNLKVAGNVLSVYGGSIISGVTIKKQIDYTLTLNKKDIKGDLKFDLKAGFVNYKASSSGSQKLASDNIAATSGSKDMSTILIGEDDAGMDVGTKQASGGYAFTNYNTSSSGDQKLASNRILGISGNANLSNILVAAYGGGLDEGTRAKASDPYAFKNYKTGQGLATNDVNAVYGNADFSEILVGESGGGLDVGTRAKATDAYTFSNYKTGQGLSSDNVYGVYGNDDLSEILIATDKGLDVATRAKASDSYTFAQYNTGSPGNKALLSNNVTSVYGNADMSEILVSTGKGLSVGSKQSAGSYTFVTYTTSSSSKLASDNVTFASGNTDMSKILVGENGGGLDVGKRDSADSSYIFTNYSTTPDSILSNDKVFAGYNTADLSTILLGTYGGGIDISSNLWFA